ncbi:hypothetical protein BDZ91DRAFT_102977 [Kalaharituber pfeilii]|nr:hypothetical protein BDZ91DRAFT_102977 [Kalaharituber pfeilii]
MNLYNNINVLHLSQLFLSSSPLVVPSRPTALEHRFRNSYIMSSMKPDVIYEPIDYRTLSKKEKFRYLITSMRKPQFDRRRSIAEADCEAEQELAASKIDISEVSDVERAEESFRQPTPRQRLVEELQQLDEFWSFKPIPKDNIMIYSRYSHSRTTLSGASSPTLSEVESFSPPCVYSPITHRDGVQTPQTDTIKEEPGTDPVWEMVGRDVDLSSPQENKRANRKPKNRISHPLRLPHARRNLGFQVRPPSDLTEEVFGVTLHT